MAAQAQTFTTPVGRLVGGSVSKPKTTDNDGKPLVVKTGANAGQPRSEFSFGLAIPKGAEQHWNQTAWGAPLWHAAVAAFPRGEYQHPTFSWKITDGDSTVPNRAGNVPSTKEGYKGNWVLWFSSGIAPRLYRLDNGQPVLLTEPDFIKTGYFVQVFASFSDNIPSQTPGMYLNPSMVCFAGYGPEISTGPDVSQAAFGAAPLPAGVLSTPPAPAAIAPPVAAPVAAAPAPAPVVVPPNPAILALPPVPAAPPAPVVAAPPARAMTAKATAPYEAYIAQGWTDELLRQHGMMG